MTELLLFIAGALAGGIVTYRMTVARLKRLLHIRGDALREITNHKWDTGEHNDAVVITRIALKGLEHKHRGIKK